MLIILPYRTQKRIIYACSIDYALCAQLTPEKKNAKLRNLIPFYEADKLLALEQYTITQKAIKTRSGNYKGKYYFALETKNYNIKLISCSEAIKALEKAFSNNIIEEPKPITLPKLYIALTSIYLGPRNIYILTPWRTWAIEKAPAKIRVKRIIISNNIALLMP